MIVTLKRTGIEMMLARKGLTKAAFSGLCGINRGNLSTILSRGTCSPKNACRIADALGVEVSEIIKEED